MLAPAPTLPRPTKSALAPASNRLSLSATVEGPPVLGRPTRLTACPEWVPGLPRTRWSIEPATDREFSWQPLDRRRLLCSRRERRDPPVSDDSSNAVEDEAGPAGSRGAAFHF